LDTKIELDNTIANGLKAEVLTQFLPASKGKGAKLNLHFRQPLFHARAFFDLLKGPSFNGDAVIGHDGFLAGAEVGYDVDGGKITKYSAAVGYSVPEYTAAVTATNNLSVFATSYYHRVNAQVEAGAKATWDAKSGNASGVGLEIASKYKLDSNAFVKAKINNQGIAALAYSQLLRPGVTLGLGASIDTQRLAEPAHKVIIILPSLPFGAQRLMVIRSDLTLYLSRKLFGRGRYLLVMVFCKLVGPDGSNFASEDLIRSRGCCFFCAQRGTVE
jgi:voltage-dependent anion channel protein 2